MRAALQWRTSFRRVDSANRVHRSLRTSGLSLADKSVAIHMRRRTSKITNPMTPIGPVPFVGRQQELGELKQHLAVVSLVSLHGALGSGKTRLVNELAPLLGAPVTLVECYPG